MKNLLILVIMLGTFLIFSCGVENQNYSSGTENQINQNIANSQLVGEPLMKTGGGPNCYDYLDGGANCVAHFCFCVFYDECQGLDFISDCFAE